MDYNLANLVHLREDAGNLVGKEVRTPLGGGRVVGFQVQVLVETAQEDPATPGRTNNYFDLHHCELIP